ncbi:MAG: phosphoribosyltransferase [archaeon]|nr:phosphoribosyltransferase [archaeon]
MEELKSYSLFNLNNKYGSYNYSSLEKIIKPKIIKPLYNSNPIEYIEFSRKEISPVRSKNLDNRILPPERNLNKIKIYSSNPSGSFAKDIDFSKLPKTPSYAFEEAKLSELLKEIESQRDPRKFKEAVLKGIQLYFDGLVEGRSEIKDSEVWEEQLEVLNAMLRGVGMTVVAFYRQNQEIPFDDIRNAIMPYDSRLIRHGSQKGCKKRHLDGSEDQVGRYAMKVANALEGEEVDLIIPVASGGFEPAVLVADYLGVNQLFPIRCSRMSRNDSGVLVPVQAPLDYPIHQISGNRILLVEDIVASGATASKLAQWVENYDPAKVYFAVVQCRGTDLVIGW